MSGVVILLSKYSDMPRLLHLIITAILILVVSIFIKCEQKAPKIHEDHAQILGPYLQRMADDQVTICWATPATSSLLYLGDSLQKKIGQYEQHQTVMARLKPGTTYQYDVLNDGSDMGKGHFTTFPDDIRPFHFAVLGDTRTRHAIHQQIVNRIIDEKPLFVVNTGDLVSNGNDMADWEAFFRINKELIRNVPYYTVLGNHEHDADNYYKFFSLPGNESYYFWSVGDALFVVLDMEGPEYHAPAFLSANGEDRFWWGISRRYFEQEKQWVENLLTLNNEAGYIFVFFHPTYYSNKKSRVAEAEQRRAFWGDIFERHHVTAVLNGHDHYYAHAIHGGTHYIITAGGGAPLYDLDDIQPETVKYKKTEHFMRIDVGQDQTIMQAIDIHGDVIEKIIANRRK